MSTERVASKDGTPIAFERTGMGPALILVGGALSERSAGGAFAARLAPSFTVYTFDRRGRGESGDTAPYAVEREVEDLEALVQGAGGSAYVLGFSSGAVLALEAAARGVAFSKLALYEPPFIVDESRPRPPADIADQVEALVASGRRGDAVALFLTAAVGLPAAAVDEMRRAPMWPSMEALAHTLRYDFAILGDMMQGRALPAGRWEAVTVPTLVLDGGASPEWMHHATRMLAEVLPNAQRNTLAGQTHAGNPEAIAPVLEDFFAD